jgi:hypothetical protein
MTILEKIAKVLRDKCPETRLGLVGYQGTLHDLSRPPSRGPGLCVPTLPVASASKCSVPLAIRRFLG